MEKTIKRYAAFGLIIGVPIITGTAAQILLNKLLDKVYDLETEGIIHVLGFDSTPNYAEGIRLLRKTTK